MNTSTSLAPPRALTQLPRTARFALRQLERLRHGTLNITLPDHTTVQFGAGEPHASIHVLDWEVFGDGLAKGDIGLAECYVRGQWTTHDLPALLGLFVRNRREIEEMVYGTWFGRVAYRLVHLARRNSRSGSRKNIQAHYDLGNDFYRLWLDATMNYSSALFEGDATRPLKEAQDAKVSRALRMAGVEPGHRVLEIGCGWGALAHMGVREFGAHVTGVTLSREQLAWGHARLGPTVADLRLQDYRDIDDGPYDAICSIEMVEAVGRQYWSGYFAKVAALLKPGGRACIQSIVIDDALWQRYIRGTDFIQQYVFPGGCLPCPAEFRRCAREAGLEIVDEYSFGKDYAITLRHWRERFLARRAEVLAQGFDESFMRLWDFYLAYCEAAFEQCNTDVVQYTLRKPS